MKQLYFYRKQAGASLLVSLIMLVVITLLAVSAIKSSNINLRIAGNVQSRDEALSAGQQAIEKFISSYSNFYPTLPAGATSYNIDINKDSTNDYLVSIAVPTCKRATAQIPPRSDDCANGARSGLICWDTVWNVTATVTGASSGVSQEVTQGVSVTFGPTFQPSAVGC